MEKTRNKNKRKRIEKEAIEVGEHLMTGIFAPLLNKEPLELLKKFIK